MLETLAHRFGVSPLVVGLLLAVAAVQVTLQAYALVDLARRDIVEGDKKLTWVLAILLGSFPGTIAYLAVGRPAKRVDIPRVNTGARTADPETARRAVEALYRKRDEKRDEH